MDETGFSHRLAAILAADAVGCSRLMGGQRTRHRSGNAARAVFRTLTEARHGRVVDMVGDYVLAVFETAVGNTVLLDKNGLRYAAWQLRGERQHGANEGGPG
jgi:class 3 adenylate cyclase